MKIRPTGRFDDDFGLDDEAQKAVAPDGDINIDGYLYPYSVIETRTIETQLIQSHNLSLKDYDKMLAKQKGVCAICSGKNKNGRRLNVDHNHTTGKIRGLLCGHCNSSLGFARDDVDILAKMMEYLLDDGVL